MSDDKPNLTDGLSQLGESMTVADLVKAKGQSRKVRAISERDLRNWIEKILATQLAGKADVYSDAEKAAVISKGQEELARMMEREQSIQAERNRLRGELDAAMESIRQAQDGSGKQQAIGAALGTLQAKLDEAENRTADLQDQVSDLQDQLAAQMAMVSSTIEEKERLRETVRNQMLRSTALIEGVIGLDHTYYGSRHQEQDQLGDDAEAEAQFYHDFEVGAKVIATLGGDLERLRRITLATGSEEGASLERDLQMLEELKSGRASAIDAAAPIASLIETVAATREEAELFAERLDVATGISGHHQTLSPAPLESDDPVTAVAAATAVVRDLQNLLQRSAGRLAGLQQLLLDAEQARSEAEVALETVAAQPPAAAPAPSPAESPAISSLIASLIAAGRNDPRLSDSTADLVLIAEDHHSTPEEIAAAAEHAVAALITVHDDAQTQAAEAAKEREALLATTKEARARLVEEVHAIITGLHSGDHGHVNGELEDRIVSLALCAERISEIDDPSTVERLVSELGAIAIHQAKTDSEERDADQAAIATLSSDLAAAAAKVAEIETDRDEAAASAREIIVQLTQQRDARERELELQLAENAAAEGQIAAVSQRALAAEATMRRLGGALSLVAKDTGESSEDARLDLELSLSELPQEGEEDVAIPHDLVRQIAEHAERLAEAVVQDRNQTVTASHRAIAHTSQAEEELERLREQLTAAESGRTRLEDRLRRVEGESAALREELLAQACEHATKVQELAASRMEVVAMKADAGVAHGRVGDLEAELLVQRANAGNAAQERDLARQALDEALERIAAADRHQHQLTDQLAALAAEAAATGASSDAAVVRAGERLEAARSHGHDALAQAAHGVVAALAERLAAAQADLSAGRSERDTLVADLDHARRSLSQATVAQADAAHRLDQVAAQTAVVEARLASAEAQRIQARSEADRVAAELANISAALLQAEADRDELQAREESRSAQQADASDSLRQDVTRLESELGSQAIAVTEAQARAEAAEARARRARDEIETRLGERDRHIATLEQRVAELSAAKNDTDASRAEIEDLTRDLATATERIKALEQSSELRAGERQKAQALASEAQRLGAERDQLRERNRGLESTLAEAHGALEEAKSQSEAVRTQLATVREQAAKDVATERARTEALKNEFRTLKDEVVALRARLRRLTGA